MNAKFQQAEDRFHALRTQLNSRQISPEQYQAAMNSLVVQDENGVLWTIDPNNGSWLKANGGAWQPGNPYPTGTGSALKQPISGPPGQGKTNRRRIACGCLTVLSLTLLACMFSLAGGYFVLRRGWISSRTIYTLLGDGPGDVEITNLSNTSLMVAVNMLDDTTYGYSVAMPLSLDPGDIGSYSIEPSRYTLTFKSESDQVMGTCTLRINTGDRYTLLAHAEEIYILRNGQVDPGGIAIPNSGFCIPTEAQ